MKRMFVLLAALGALAAIAVPVSSAANNGNNGNGATVQRFSTSYNDAWFGPANCKGDHIVKTAPKAFIQDDENCTLQGVGSVGVYTSPKRQLPRLNIGLRQ